MKDHQKKEVIVEILKKINDKQPINAQEEEIIKRLDNETTQSPLMKKKTQNFSEAVSNVIIKHKDQLNLKKLAQRLESTKPMESSESINIRSKFSTHSKKRMSIVTKNFSSQMGIFGMLVSKKQSSYYDYQSPKTAGERFKTENYLNEVREKVVDLNQRMKDKIQNDLSVSKILIKNISSHVEERKKINPTKSR